MRKKLIKAIRKYHKNYIEDSNEICPLCLECEKHIENIYNSDKCDYCEEVYPEESKICSLYLSEEITNEDIVEMCDKRLGK